MAKNLSENQMFTLKEPYLALEPPVPDICAIVIPKTLGVTVISKCSLNSGHKSASLCHRRERRTQPPLIKVHVADGGRHTAFKEDATPTPHW